MSKMRIPRSRSVLTLSGNQTVSATGPAGAIANYSATATDDADPAPVVTCNPPSGSMFPLGPTTVSCTATDAAGRVTTGTTQIIVVDDIPPVISGTPAELRIEATSAAGAVATWNGVTATDAVSGSVAVTCVPSSGATFPLGTRFVTCSAADAAGNTAASMFSVTVSDTTGPAITNLPGNLTREALTVAGTPVTWAAPAATDAVNGSVPVTCSPASGVTFPVGSTEVTCSATDAAGNIRQASFTVVVSDTTAPTIVNVPANLVVEATSSAGATVGWSSPTATDSVSGSLPVN